MQQQSSREGTPRRAVVITGASTGIGAAAVGILIGAGYQVFGGVRRTEDAERLLHAHPEHCTPLMLDVTNDDSVHAAAAVVNEWLGPRTLGGLVNNAGIARGGPLLYQSLREFQDHFDVNLFGVLRATKAFAPLLGADLRTPRDGAPGRIVMISSVGGRIAAPFLGAYASSKHALEGLSDALRRELMSHGIDVIVIAPGHVATPIWDKAEAIDYHKYDETEYAGPIARFRALFLPQGKNGAPPERVGRIIRIALEHPHPKARYSVVTDRLRNWTIPALLPKRFLDRRIAKILGFPRFSGTGK